MSGACAAKQPPQDQGLPAFRFKTEPRGSGSTGITGVENHEISLFGARRCLKRLFEFKTAV
jgi:hypothetical protein